MSSEAFDTVHILIVAGKTYNVRLLRGILSSLGVYEVRVAATTSAALQHLARRDFHVVFCDENATPLDMPSFVTAVRRRGAVRDPSIPILIMANALRRSEVEHMRDTGVNGLLVPPLTAAAVRRKLIGALSCVRKFVEAETYVGPDRRRPSDRRRAPAALTRSAPQERRVGRLKRRRTDLET